MIAGDWLGAHYVASSLASFVIVVLFGYWLHTEWTWPQAPRDRVTLARYTVSMAGNLPLFVAGMFLLVDLGAAPVAAAAPLVTVLLIAFNFIATRWALRVRDEPGARAIPELARPPLPAWYPPDAEIERMLASYQPLYKWRRPRYALQLLKDIALLVPEGPCRLLDIGGGSGLIAQAIADFFPGKTVTAIDVVDRFLPQLRIEHRLFDGRRVPYGDGAFDCALLSNVLHHVPLALRAQLVAEALRVTGGRCVVVKDHAAPSALHRARLAWLDFIGNLPFGGMVWAQYLSETAWQGLFLESGCVAERLAPAPYRSGLARLVFPDRLEVLFRLRHAR